MCSEVDVHKNLQRQDLNPLEEAQAFRGLSDEFGMTQEQIAARVGRSRTAVAAAADYFYNKRWKANGVALLFNTVPLERKGGGLGNGATDHVDRLIDEGWNLVMFAEGTRSRDGEIGKVHSGAAVIAAQHGIDIVPIYVSGTHDAMPPGQNWPKRKPGRILSRRHKVEVRFGAPIAPRDESLRRCALEQRHRPR